MSKLTLEQNKSNGLMFCSVSKTDILDSITIPQMNFVVDVIAVFTIMLSYHMTWYEYIKSMLLSIGGIFSFVRIRVIENLFIRRIYFWFDHEG